VVSVVPTTNDIPVVGDLLERGPVRMLSFNGSTRVGSALLAQTAARVINCSMELGGNAPSTKTAWRSSRGVSPSRVPGCASATAWTREPTSGR